MSAPDFTAAVEQAHHDMIRAERWARVEEELALEFDRDHVCHDPYCQHTVIRAIRVRQLLQQIVTRGQ